MMHRRGIIAIGFFAILVLVVLGVFLLKRVSTTTPHRVYHVGILNGLDLFALSVEGFKEKLEQLGYREGENISYDIVYTNFDPAKEKEALQRFIANHVDLIVSCPTEVSQEAKRATVGTNIPVIFMNAFTEGSDLVESLGHPGGNMTGVRYPGFEIIVKNLNTMHVVAPHATRIYAPYDSAYPATAPTLEALRPVAAALGLTLVEDSVTSFEELSVAVDKRLQAKDPGVDAIITMPNTITASPRGVQIIGQLALKHKIPYEAPVSEDNMGSLFMENPDPYETGVHAALLADKVLHGVSAGSIPVTSSDPKLYINVAVAKAFGITIPEQVMARAYRIVH